MGIIGRKMYTWHQPLPKTYGSEHFLPIAIIPSWGEFSGKDRTKKNAFEKSCLPFQNVSIFQVLEQVPKPIGIKILFPKAFFFQKKFRLTSVALFVFIPKKNSPSNSKALGIFQKTPKLPANHALHLSHVERFPVGRPKPRR